jgi:hypothetical protein
MSEQAKNKEWCIVEIETASTDTELRTQMKQMKEMRENGCRYITCSVRGYDKDERELHQIPEARGLMRRCWSLGFASHLDVFTDPQFCKTEPRELGTMKQYTLGAFTAWAIAYRPFKRVNGGYRTMINKRVLNTFYAALMKANAACDAEIGPCAIDY